MSIGDFFKNRTHTHTYFCHDNSRRDWDGNVHDNVKVFGLGRIDLLLLLLHCCGRSSTEACYCQYIHKMLLWACTKHWCCTYNIHEITPPPSVHESPHSRSIQVELGKVEDFWSMLLTATASTNHIFGCWAASSLSTDTGESQSAVPCDKDVIKSDWVRPIGLRQLQSFLPELCIQFNLLISLNFICILVNFGHFR